MSGYDSRGSNSQFSFDVQGLALTGGPMDLTPANALTHSSWQSARRSSASVPASPSPSRTNFV
eukprot:6011508-Pleurochrysis_carterae.AAC.1